MAILYLFFSSSWIPFTFNASSGEDTTGADLWFVMFFASTFLFFTKRAVNILKCIHSRSSSYLTHFVLDGVDSESEATIKKQNRAHWNSRIWNNLSLVGANMKNKARNRNPTSSCQQEWSVQSLISRVAFKFMRDLWGNSRKHREIIHSKRHSRCHGDHCESASSLFLQRSREWGEGVRTKVVKLALIEGGIVRAILLSVYLFAYCESRRVSKNLMMINDCVFFQISIVWIMLVYRDYWTAKISEVRNCVCQADNRARDLSHNFFVVGLLLD